MISVVKSASASLQSHSRQWLFCLFTLFSLAGCDRQVPPVQFGGDIMGTTWSVSYIEGSHEFSPRQVQEEVEALLAEVNLSMSTYRIDSEISAFNAYDAKKWFSSSDELFTVLKAALDVGQKSGGAYDITVGALVELWGFGPGDVIEVPPAEDEIVDLLSRVGQANLRLDAHKRRILKQTDLSVDVSSLAKGYAVDQVAQWLSAQGVTRYMVEVGGEIRLSGFSGRGDPWRIAIEQPKISERSIALTLNLTDVAIATSGDYRNYFEADGRRYSHSLDPRTGYPVAHDLVSVTVVHQRCMMADAWATALIVLGVEKAMAVAQAHGLAVYFIRRLDDKFVHSQTPLFGAYLPSLKG